MSFRLSRAGPSMRSPQSRWHAPSHLPILSELTMRSLCSEITVEGQRVTKLDQILLNGNNIALVRPPLH